MEMGPQKKSGRDSQVCRGFVVGALDVWEIGQSLNYSSCLWSGIHDGDGNCFDWNNDKEDNKC